MHYISTVLKSYDSFFVRGTDQNLSYSLIILPSSGLLTSVTGSLSQWVELENWISPIHEQIIQFCEPDQLIH